MRHGGPGADWLSQLYVSIESPNAQLAIQVKLFRGRVSPSVDNPADTSMVFTIIYVEGDPVRSHPSCLYPPYPQR